MSVVIKLNSKKCLETDLKYVYFTHLSILHLFSAVSNNLQLEQRERWDSKQKVIQLVQANSN